MERPWTEKDRKKVRQYHIYVDRSKFDTFNSDLDDATRKWDRVATAFPSHRVTLYADTRRFENMCSQSWPGL